MTYRHTYLTTWTLTDQASIRRAIRRATWHAVRPVSAILPAHYTGRVVVRGRNY